MILACSASLRPGVRLVGNAGTRTFATTGTGNPSAKVSLILQ